MKIIDGFIFFCEIEMLKFRLEELYNHVDYFIITESNKTFTNMSKPWNFLENKELFQKYMDKIIYVQIENMPDGDDPWVRENFQRDSIIKGIKTLNLDQDDIVMISDLDEIPDTDTLDILRNQGLNDGIYQIGQDFYYYDFTFKNINKWYLGTKYIKFGYINFPLNLVRQTNFIILPYKGGWHLSYFGDPKFISYKIKSFSHHELNIPKFTDENLIQSRISNNQDLFERNYERWEKVSINENSYLPKNWKMLVK